MRKEPTMKLTNLLWVLALAGSVAACNSGSAITGTPPVPPPTGGSNGGGGGGTGGALDGACTTDPNDAVYADLDYVNGKGVAESGADAASAIASDCLRGASTAVPPIPPARACGSETLAVVGCFPTCSDAIIAALSTCVVECQQITIEEITGSRLSVDCGACYGETVACGAAKCTSPSCVAEPQGTVCTACRCEMGCTPDFVTCSGLPTTDCG